MRFAALATDYDETLADHGTVVEGTEQALERLRKSGRKLLLVTGRDLDDLLRVFPRVDLFDAVVAENGALPTYPTGSGSAAWPSHLLRNSPPPCARRECRSRRGE
jgi:HAD superfamily hydrolase (TIGR01484 family)